MINFFAFHSCHCEEALADVAIHTKRRYFSNAWIASLALAMTVLFFPQTSRADEYQSCRQSLTEWNTCQTDNDCAIIPDVCGSMTGATAASHQQEATDCTLKLRTEVRCATLVKPGDLPPQKAVCEKGACKAVPVTQ